MKKPTQPDAHPSPVGGCTEAWSEKLLWLVNETLEEDEAARVEAHLEVCEDCRGEAAELRLEAEPAVVVVTSSPHREAAYASNRFCIDSLKATVPIWKREAWDGGAHWGTYAQHVVDLEDLDADSAGGSS